MPARSTSRRTTRMRQTWRSDHLHWRARGEAGFHRPRHGYGAAAAASGVERRSVIIEKRISLAGAADAAPIAPGDCPVELALYPRCCSCRNRASGVERNTGARSIRLASVISATVRDAGLLARPPPLAASTANGTAATIDKASGMYKVLRLA